MDVKESDAALRIWLCSFYRGETKCLSTTTRRESLVAELDSLCFDFPISQAGIPALPP